MIMGFWDTVNPIVDKATCLLHINFFLQFINVSRRDNYKIINQLILDLSMIKFSLYLMSTLGEL